MSAMCKNIWNVSYIKKYLKNEFTWTHGEHLRSFNSLATTLSREKNIQERQKRLYEEENKVGSFS